MPRRKGISTSGKCRFCEETFSKAAIGSHLNKCAKRKKIEEATDIRRVKLIHLTVQGRYAPQYWMHLEVVANAKLKALDKVLRDTWLECCGHLSAFTIEGKRYVSMVDRNAFFDFGVKENNMNFEIDAVVKPGLRFGYEYDFGTTTTLSLRALSEREGKPINRLIQIMARNEPPTMTCDVCGKVATQVCTQCIWDGKGWLCDKCANDHECEEEMLLPVVNSPRVGMCGYMGEAYE